MASIATSNLNGNFIAGVDQITPFDARGLVIPWGGASNSSDYIGSSQGGAGLDLLGPIEQNFQVTISGQAGMPGGEGAPGQRGLPGPAGPKGNDGLPGQTTYVYISEINKLASC